MNSCIVCGNPISQMIEADLLCGQCVAEATAGSEHYGTFRRIVRDVIAIAGIDPLNEAIADTVAQSLASKWMCPNCGDDILLYDDGVYYCTNCEYEPRTEDAEDGCPKCGNTFANMLVWQGDDHRDGVLCTICGHRTVDNVQSVADRAMELRMWGEMTVDKSEAPLEEVVTALIEDGFETYDGATGLPGGETVVVMINGMYQIAITDYDDQDIAHIRRDLWTFDV